MLLFSLESLGGITSSDVVPAEVLGNEHLGKPMHLRAHYMYF